VHLLAGGVAALRPVQRDQQNALIAPFEVQVLAVGQAHAVVLLT
jgi:hypothetical protein